MPSLWHERVYEPKKRLFEGRYQWARHRFPIKGGITFRDVVRADFLKANVLIRGFAGEETVYFRGIPIRVKEYYTNA